MKNIFFVLIMTVASSSAFAKQTLQEAMDLNPQLAGVISAIKAGAGKIDCLTEDTFQTNKIYGPEGRMTTTHQAACFDPLAENPSQFGQLMVTFYGDGLAKDSKVGEVVDIQFTVFK